MSDRILSWSKYRLFGEEIRTKNSGKKSWNKSNFLAVFFVFIWCFYVFQFTNIQVAFGSLDLRSWGSIKNEILLFVPITSSQIQAILQLECLNWCKKRTNINYLVYDQVPEVMYQVLEESADQNDQKSGDKIPQTLEDFIAEVKDERPDAKTFAVKLKSMVLWINISSYSC